VDVGAAEGLQAPGGVYPIAVQGGGGSADLTLDVAAGGLAGFDVTVPADIPAGSPFPVDIQAVSSAGAPLTSSDTVYLASEDGLVNFTGAQQAQAGPTTVQAALSGGSAEVIAVASVAGPTTITVTDAAGLSGSAQVQVASPAAGGLRLQVFPPFSGYAGATAVYAAADVDTLNRLSGVLLQGAGSAARAYGGWWPNDPGQGYEAQWSGVLTVVAPPVAPSPLPQPTLQFAFLNVAAKGGTATLQPVTGSGGSVNGSQIGASLATAAGGTGWIPPSVVTLTPGQYDLTVQAAEDRADGGSGDTLYYSEAFAPAAPAGPFAPSAGATWTPLRPVPPAAFTAQGLPSPALVVPIGAAQADDAGAPLALLQPAQIDSGRTLLPLRAVSELLGAAVTWDAATQGITVTGPGGAAALTVGSAQATVNGLAVTLDQPALLLPPGVTMVPLRFLGQALGWQVGWAAAASAAWLLPPLLPAVPLQP